MAEYFYLISDYGDGTCGLDWFKTKELAEKLVEEDGQYWSNEGVVRSVFAKDLQVSFKEDYYKEED